MILLVNKDKLVIITTIIMMVRVKNLIGGKFDSIKLISPLLKRQNNNNNSKNSKASYLTNQNNLYQPNSSSHVKDKKLLND